MSERSAHPAVGCETPGGPRSVGRSTSCCFSSGRRRPAAESLAMIGYRRRVAVLSGCSPTCRNVTEGPTEVAVTVTTSPPIGRRAAAPSPAATTRCWSTPGAGRWSSAPVSRRCWSPLCPVSWISYGSSPARTCPAVMGSLDRGGAYPSAFTTCRNAGAGGPGGGSRTCSNTPPHNGIDALAHYGWIQAPAPARSPRPPSQHHTWSPSVATASERP